MKLDKKLLTTLAAGAVTTLAPAATIVADTADASARSNGSTGQAGNAALFAGAYYAAGPGLVAVFPFLLPTLAAGESFGSATITLDLVNLFSPPVAFNLDVVGITRINASPTIAGADWGAAGTMLNDNFLTPTSSLGASTSTDFASWLNTQYANGANAGSYVFIRADAEGTTSGQAAYNIATANHATAQVPTINFTVTSVPEPSSAALLGLSGLALLARRRK